MELTRQFLLVIQIITKSKNAFHWIKNKVLVSRSELKNCFFYTVLYVVKTSLYSKRKIKRYETTNTNLIFVVSITIFS